MRLREWVTAGGKGAISRLVAVTGLTYPTIHALARDKRRARYETAAIICAATGGVVSIAELCELPRRAPRRRLRKRPRASSSLAPAASA